MKIYGSRESLGRIEKGLALTIGNFDGVHLGHQAIIKSVRKAARKFNAAEEV